MNTKTKGIITETETELSFEKLGYTVSFPFGDNARYDLIVDIDGILLRIQCKSAEKSADGKSFYFEGANSRYQNGEYVKIYYDSSEIDYFATTLDGKCYLIPVEQVHRRKFLRLIPSDSGQIKRVNWAKDYELEKVVERIKSKVKSDTVL